MSGRAGSRRPVLLLLILGLLAFGVFAPKLGFYSDDWVLLELLSQGGRLGAWKALAASGTFWPRPLAIAQYALFFFAGGSHPLALHAIVSAEGLLEACLLFFLFKRLVGDGATALAAAALAYLDPNRAVIHVWFANTPQPTAHLLALGSFLLHLRWRRSRSPAILFASLAVFFAAVLTYESIFFLPLFLAAGVALDRDSPAEGAIDGGQSGLLYLAPMALALAWQWWAVPHWLGGHNPKSGSLGFSSAHFLKTYGAGFECVTNRTLDLIWRNLSAMRAWRPVSIAAAMLAAALAAAVGAKINDHEEEKEKTRAAAKRALVLAGAAFIAGYLPYAMSSTYTPQIFGVMSRTNGIGAWAGGLLIAGLLGLCSARWRGPLLGMILAVFVLANWQTNREWTRAWTQEQAILTQVTPHARELPPGANVLLAGAPHFEGVAVVFDSTYDFDAALRLDTGRADLHGFVAPPERPGAYRYDFATRNWSSPR